MQTQTAEQTNADQLKDFAKLGTVSPSHYSGFNFCTVNKPSHTHGTGYGITTDSELSLQSELHSLAFVGWGSGQGVEKYKDAQDFIKRNAWAEYYILESEVQ